jgi:hypothetical protein
MPGAEMRRSRARRISRVFMATSATVCRVAQERMQQRFGKGERHGHDAFEVRDHRERMPLEAPDQRGHAALVTRS